MTIKSNSNINIKDDIKSKISIVHETDSDDISSALIKLIGMIRSIVNKR